MKITTIEVIPLRLPYEDRIRKAFYHFGMNEEVTVYKFHTDTGLVGLCENPGPPFEQTLLDPYLGTNPFDHVMGTGSFQPRHGLLRPNGQTSWAAGLETDGSTGAGMGEHGLVDAQHVARGLSR